MKAKLGSGKRFAELRSKFMRGGESESRAEGLAAAIGRKKLGKAKFQKLAAAGLRRHYREE